MVDLPIKGVISHSFLYVYQRVIPVHMEVSINGGTLKWMVPLMENPNQKWMMTGGTPVLGNLHMDTYGTHVRTQ